LTKRLWCTQHISFWKSHVDRRAVLLITFINVCVYCHVQL